MAELLIRRGQKGGVVQRISESIWNDSTRKEALIKDGWNEVPQSELKLYLDEVKNVPAPKAKPFPEKKGN